METISYQLMGLLWEPKWPLPMPASSWANWSNNFSSSQLETHCLGFALLDVDMKWNKSNEDLHSLITHVNNFHLTIKFTQEVSKTNITFLDTSSTLSNRSITTFVTKKLPSVCDGSFAYSEALPIKWICSNIDNMKQQLGVLRGHLKRRGYKKQEAPRSQNPSPG